MGDKPHEESDEKVDAGNDCCGRRPQASRRAQRMKRPKRGSQISSRGGAKPSPTVEAAQVEDVEEQLKAMAALLKTMPNFFLHRPVRRYPHSPAKGGRPPSGRATSACGSR